jgi:hypothetical protein
MIKLPVFLVFVVLLGWLIDPRGARGVARAVEALGRGALATLVGLAAQLVAGLLVGLITGDIARATVGPFIWIGLDSGVSLPPSLSPLSTYATAYLPLFAVGIIAAGMAAYGFRRRLIRKLIDQWRNKPLRFTRDDRKYYGLVQLVLLSRMGEELLDIDVMKEEDSNGVESEVSERHLVLRQHVIEVSECDLFIRSRPEVTGVAMVVTVPGQDPATIPLDNKIDSVGFLGNRELEDVPDGTTVEVTAQLRWSKMNLEFPICLSPAQEVPDEASRRAATPVALRGAVEIKSSIEDPTQFTVAKLQRYQEKLDELRDIDHVHRWTDMPQRKVLLLVTDAGSLQLSVAWWPADVLKAGEKKLQEAK